MSEHELYKSFIIDLYKHPLNKRIIDDAQKVSLKNPICGDNLDCMCIITKDHIEDISYMGTGCAISEAAASLLTDHIHGKSLDDVKKMTPDDVVALLGIPIGYSRMKCATLFFNALQQRISNE